MQDIDIAQQVQDNAWNLDYTEALKVRIGGVDVSSDMIKVSGLEQVLDYPTPTEFVADDVLILLLDTTGKYNPRRADNFFARLAGATGNRENPDAERLTTFPEVRDIPDNIFKGSDKILANWQRKGIDKTFNQTAYSVPIEIFLGYSNDIVIRVFSGTLIDIDYEARSAVQGGIAPTVQITASDNTQPWRRADIKDFGIERALQLYPTIIHAEYRGVYTFSATHVSEGSVYSERELGIFSDLGYEPQATAAYYIDPVYVNDQNVNIPLNNGKVEIQKHKAKSDSETIDEEFITIKNVVETNHEGELNHENFSMDEQKGLLEVEGGRILDNEFNRADPNVRFKHAYRYRRVDKLIEDLLKANGIEESDMEIDIPHNRTEQAFFQSHGTLSWFVEGKVPNDLDVEAEYYPRNYDRWHWGVIRDFVYEKPTDEHKGKFIFLYSYTHDTLKDKIVEYDRENDEYTVLAEIRSPTAQNPKPYSEVKGRNYHEQYGHEFICWRIESAKPGEYFIVGSVSDQFHQTSINNFRSYYPVNPAKTDQTYIKPVILLVKTVPGTVVKTASVVADRIESPNLAMAYTNFSEHRFPDTRKGFKACMVADDGHRLYFQYAKNAANGLAEFSEYGLKSITVLNGIPSPPVLHFREIFDGRSNSGEHVFPFSFDFTFDYGDNLLNGGTGIPDSLLVCVLDSDDSGSNIANYKRKLNFHRLDLNATSLGSSRHSYVYPNDVVGVSDMFLFHRTGTSPILYAAVFGVTNPESTSPNKLMGFVLPDGGAAVGELVGDLEFRNPHHVPRSPVAWKGVGDTYETVYFFQGCLFKPTSIERAKKHANTVLEGRLLKIEDCSVSSRLRCWNSPVPASADERIESGVHESCITRIVATGDGKDGEGLFFVAGYGDMKAPFIRDDEWNPKKGYDYQFVSADADFDPESFLNNWQFIEYSNKLNNKLPLFLTNKIKVWEALEILARLTNCIIGFSTEPDKDTENKKRFVFRQRDRFVSELLDPGLKSLGSLINLIPDKTSARSTAYFFPDTDRAGTAIGDSGKNAKISVTLTGSGVSGITVQIGSVSLTGFETGSAKETKAGNYSNIDRITLSGSFTDVTMKVDLKPENVYTADDDETTQEIKLRNPKGFLIPKYIENDKEYGEMLVDNEVIKYEIRKDTDGNFVGFYVAERGFKNTDIAGHRGGAEDNFAHAEKGAIAYKVSGYVYNHGLERNLIDMVVNSDFEYLANKVTAFYGGLFGEDLFYPIDDPTSIAANGEHTQNLHFPMLDQHQREWAKLLTNQYLRENSRVNYFLNMVVRWSPHIEIGDIIVVHQPERAHVKWEACRVLNVQQDYDNSKTMLSARTLRLG